MVGRVVRGFNIIKQGVRGSKSCRPYSPQSPPLIAARTNATTAVGARQLAIRSAGVCARNRNDVYQQEARQDALPTVLHHALVLRRGRHSGGQSGGSEDERRPGAVANGDTEQPYKFLEKGNRDEISSGSKEQHLGTEEAPAKAVGEEEGVEFRSMTMWQKGKNVWQKAKHVRATVKLMWKQYGAVAIGTYAFLYVGGLGSAYVVMATGLVEPNVDTSAMMQQMAEFTGADNSTLSDYIKHFQHLVETNPKYEKLLMAFLANEFIDFPREVIVFFATPSIARALGRAPAKTAKRKN